MLVCVGVVSSTDQKICFLISKFSLKVLGVLVEPEVFPVFYFQETVGPSLLRIVKGPGSTFLMCIFCIRILNADDIAFSGIAMDVQCTGSPGGQRAPDSE